MILISEVMCIIGRERERERERESIIMALLQSRAYHIIVFLWPPYLIGQAIIFCPVVSSSIFYLLFYFLA